MHNDWLPEELEQIKNEQLTYDELCELLPRHTRQSIYNTSYKLGYTKRPTATGYRCNRWTGEELEILKNADKYTFKELYAALPKHTRNSILSKSRQVNAPKVANTIHSRRYSQDKGWKYLYINGKKVMEHRYVMEQHLKRKLLDSEIVHHRNLDKTDNRIENLYICSQSEHMRLHATANQIIRRLLEQGKVIMNNGEYKLIS